VLSTNMARARLAMLFCCRVVFLEELCGERFTLLNVAQMHVMQLSVRYASYRGCCCLHEEPCGLGGKYERVFSAHANVPLAGEA
jgi:hypothetical protein